MPLIITTPFIEVPIPPTVFGYRVIGPAGGIQNANDLQIGPDGYLYALMGDSSADAVALFKFDPSNNYAPVWGVSTPSSSAQNGGSIAFGTFGDIYIVMRDFTGAKWVNNFLKIDATTGMTISWQKTVDVHSDYLWITPSNTSDGFFVGSKIFISGLGTRNGIVRYNGSGVEVWKRAYQPISGAGQIISAVADSSDNLYVCGNMFNGVSATSPWVAKLSSVDGSTVWARRVAAGSGYGDFYDIAFDGNGDLVCVGRYDNSPYTGFIARFDTNGNNLSQFSFGDGVTSTYVDSVAVDQSGNVITGHNSGTSNVAVAKWNSSDVLQWQRVITNAASFIFPYVAVDSAGNVFVNASTTQLSTNADMGLWKFPDSLTLPETVGSFTIGAAGFTKSLTSFTVVGAAPDSETSSFTLTEATPTFTMTNISPPTSLDVEVNNW